MSSRDTLGRQQEMLCIPVSQLPGWLYSINSKKVKPETAPLLLIFQRQLQTALWAYVKGDLSYEYKQKLDETTAQLKDVLKENAELRQENKDLRNEIADVREEGRDTRELLDEFIVVSGYAATVASHGMHAAKKVKHLRSIQGGAA